LSCSKNKKTDFDYTQNIIHVKGEPLQIEELIGNPYSITHIDTLLIYCDRYKGKSLSVFDLKNNRFVGRFVSEGQGPNEVIPLLFLFPYPQKDKLYTYQRDMAIISIFDVPNFQMQNNIKIASRPTSMQKAKDYYIGMGIFDKGRFGIYDNNGEFLYTGGTYPYQGEGMKISTAYTLYQGQICANPEKNYFAAGCLFSDHISFYEVTENEVILRKEYYSYDTTVGYTNRLEIKNNSILNYTWAFGTASYYYMLFSGKTYGETGKTGGGHYIIVFDWQGNYVKTYNTDYEIYTFCVDENNNCIYATALDENLDYVIIRLEIQ